MAWQAALVGLCMGIGLAAAAGFRIFVPLLLSGLALRFNLFAEVSQFASTESWLASNTALVCFAVATVLEVLAYKIPWLDNILDGLAAPAALGAGALLASQFLAPIDNPFLRYGLGIIAGAGSAGVVYSSTAAARLVSTKTTAGIANPFVSLGELIASILTTFLSFVMPVLVALLFVLFSAGMVVLWKRLRSRHLRQTPPATL